MRGLAGILIVAVAIAGLATGAAAATSARTGAAHSGATAAKVVTDVPPGQITINGDVAQSRTLKWSELASLPQQTISVSIGGVTHTEQGPFLSDVVNLSTPNFLACNRNNLLRWWILVSSSDGSATVLGRGQIDTGFGNRPAILSISEDGKFLSMNGGPRLIVPGDGASSEDISHVVMVTTRMATPQLAIQGCDPISNRISPTVGSLIVNGDVANPVTLSFVQLGSMSQVTQTVSFLNGTTPVTNTETGPTLASVLAVAKPKFRSGCPGDALHWYVAITGSDGYVSILAYPEIDPTLGNRNPLVSLNESGASLANVGPRVLQIGDVRGGRAVSGVVALTLFRVMPRIPAPGC